MKQRILYILRIYLFLLAGFILQKPLFMWIDKPDGVSYAWTDVCQVILHGLQLDLPSTGYLVAAPLLILMWLGWWPRAVEWRRLATPYYVVVSLLIAGCFVADVALYPFWQFKLDATVFIYLDSPKGALASVSTGFVAVRVACALVYFGLLLWGLRALTPRVLSPLRGYRLSAYHTLFWLVVAIPLVISIRGGVSESTANIGKVYYSPDEFLNHSAVNPFFSMFYSLGKTQNYEDEFNYFPEARRAELFDGLYVATPVATDTLQLLRTRRPNVLLILMEGFGGQFVESVSGNTEIAPHYNRLAREGILFTHCYSNSYRTDRGALSALSGYPAFPTASVMKHPVKSRTLPCLPASLHREGYTNSFLYGGDINFTNMQSYLRTGGYQRITSDVDFAISDRKNAWGVNDDITFDYLYQLMERQSSAPWHIGYLTLSSHEPFEVPYNRLAEAVPNAFAFTDHCLGQFVERVRQTPLWDDLLIVLIPDHGFRYPVGISHEQHHHNTMLWIGGAVKEPRVVSTLMNQCDMPATLLGQLGIDHSDYTFSRDVFSTAYRFPFAHFTFREGFGIVDSTGCTVYNIVGNEVKEDYPAQNTLPRDVQQAQQQRRVERGKAILQSFYDDLGARGVAD